LVDTADAQWTKVIEEHRHLIVAQIMAGKKVNWARYDATVLIQSGHMMLAAAEEGQNG
jgi:hypothetical protein